MFWYLSYSFLKISQKMVKNLFFVIFLFTLCSVIDKLYLTTQHNNSKIGLDMFRINGQFGTFGFSIGDLYFSVGIGRLHSCSSKNEGEEQVVSDNCELAIMQGDSGEFVTKEFMKIAFNEDIKDDVLWWVSQERFEEIIKFQTGRKLSFIDKK